MKVYIGQVLCPKRHAIIGYAIEMEESFVRELENQLDVLKEGLIAESAINPWCGICGAPADTWTCEVAPSHFKTLAEARPSMEGNARDQAISRAIIDMQKQKAKLN